VMLSCFMLCLYKFESFIFCRNKLNDVGLYLSVVVEQEQLGGTSL
jgi:hypothetical protein